MMNEPLIGDHTPSAHPDLTAGFRGLVNRDPVAQKQGYSAVIPPAQIKVYPRSDWPKMIADKVASKSQLSDIMKREPGWVCLDQNGQGFCWAYGSTGALIAARAKAKQPYVRLSAHAVGCKVKGFRDEGGWGALSLEFIQTNGVPDVAHWAEKSMSRSNDTAATWANAKLYMPDESFVDLASAVYDRNLAFEQQITCLLDNNPTVDDYDHWGHCVWGADAVDGGTQRTVSRSESGKLMSLAEFDLAWGMNNPVTGGIAKRIGNSWKDWGDRGFGTLSGDKAVGNNSVAICSAIA